MFKFQSQLFSMFTGSFPYIPRGRVLGSTKDHRMLFWVQVCSNKRHLLVTRVRLGVKTCCDMRVCMRWIVYVCLSYSESTIMERVLSLVHRSSWRLPLEFCCNSCGMLLASSHGWQ